MKALKELVTRTVDPIRATEAHKDRMREELLSHLLSCVEEERNRGAVEAAAVVSAVKRFGDPNAVRKELQASVPLVERIFFARMPLHEKSVRSAQLLQQRPGESVVRHAARVTCYSLLAISALDVLAVTWMCIHRGLILDTSVTELQWRLILAAIACVQLPAVALTMPMCILGHLFGKAMCGRGLTRVLAAVGCSLAAGAALLSCAFVVRALGPLSEEHLAMAASGWMLNLTPVVPPAFALCSYFAARDRKRRQQWGPA